MQFHKRFTIAALALASALAGCSNGTSVVGSAPVPALQQAQATPGITVTEGGTIVEKRVPIKLSQPGRAVQSTDAAAAFPYDISYVSQVPPVKVGADTVQANDMAICPCGTGAYIAYNMAGDKFAGAIQMLDISDKQKPKITREIKFDSMDINALYIDGGFLYFAGQADPDRWGYQSFVGKIDLSNPTSTQIMGSLVALRSYAATSITKFNNQIYVGVGAKDGGVEVLSTDLKKASFVALPDVRSVDYSAAGVVALAGTIDNSEKQGRVVTLGAADKTISLPNFEGKYAKATLEVDKLGYEHIGISKEGYKVLNPASKNTLFSLPNPSTDPLEVTNGVSTDGDLAFLANGGYGFRVVQIKDRSKHDADFGFLAGYHQMKGAAYDGKSYSANFLRYKGNHLFVASGLGGVNIYCLTAK